MASIFLDHLFAGKPAGVLGLNFSPQGPPLARWVLGAWKGKKFGYGMGLATLRDSEGEEVFKHTYGPNVTV